MKTITRQETIVNTIEEYEATDGTIFKDRRECEEYEGTAKAVIRSRFYNTFGINSEYDNPRTVFGQDTMFYRCSDEDFIFSVTPKSISELDTIAMYFKQEHGYSNREFYVPEYVGKTLYFGYNYDREPYFLGEREELIKEFIAQLDKIDNAGKEDK